MSQAWLDRLAELARQREAAGLCRRLSPRPDTDDCVDLAGNDYLGLSRHPDVLAAATSAVKRYGLGATASRLVRGSTDVHAELERELAALLGCQAALVFSSGYLANLAVVRAVATTLPGGSLIVSDGHNHASLVDGCRLVAREGATVLVYAHADPEAAASIVDSAAPGTVAVLTESVFSVYGDLAPLAELYPMVQANGGVLVVDDAHALGVRGPEGGGAARAAGLAGRPDVVVTATLSKALGAAGGVVAGPAVFIRHLVETARTFIFDTGLPPGVAAGALAAVELSAGPAGAAARAELADRATFARQRLTAVGLEVPASAAGVLAVGAPGPAEAVAWAEACRARGVAVGCFRPPSTPDGRSWLRLTINVSVPREDFERAVATIVDTVPVDGGAP